LRGTDEQMKDIMRRAERLRERKSAKSRIASLAGSSLLSLVLLIAAASYIPALGGHESVSAADGHYGSLIISGPGLGYAVIGILAFVLGICVTLLCLALRDYHDLRD